MQNNYLFINFLYNFNIFNLFLKIVVWKQLYSPLITALHRLETSALHTISVIYQKIFYYHKTSFTSR